MRTYPLIGIPVQTLEAATPGGLTGWIANPSYARALTQCRATPMLFPLLPEDPEHLHNALQSLDGILLAGGVDVHPERYGKPQGPMCGPTDRDRDATEIQLVHLALEYEIPLLGICRGMQLLNVALGGTLHQDLASDRPGSSKHDYYGEGAPDKRFLAHEVRIESQSLLGRVLPGSSVPVNSLHHQGVDRLAEGLSASAYAPDGLIEALERPSGSFLLAVQWHPEEMLDAPQSMKPLFEHFVSYARARHRFRS